MFRMFGIIFAQIAEAITGLGHFIAAFSAAGKYAEEVVNQTILDARQEAEIARAARKLPE